MSATPTNTHRIRRAVKEIELLFTPAELKVQHNAPVLVILCRDGANDRYRFGLHSTIAQIDKAQVRGNTAAVAAIEFEAGADQPGFIFVSTNSDHWIWPISTAQPTPFSNSWYAPSIIIYGRLLPISTSAFRAPDVASKSRVAVDNPEKSGSPSSSILPSAAPGLNTAFSRSNFA